MKKDVKLHPLHAQGKYYVDDNYCLACDTCSFYAPENFKFDKETASSYVAKQPETPDEEKLCKQALLACAVETIFDDGDDS